MKWLLFLYPWLELWSLIELGTQTSATSAMLWVFGAGVLGCLLYTSPSPRDLSTSRMPSSA